MNISFALRFLREAWRKPIVHGAVGVLLIYATLGIMHILMTQMYLSGDEPRHVAYAIQLADNIPTKITDKVPADKVFTAKAGQMAAAAHPPLYYWYVGPALDNATTKAQMKTRVRRARFMTLALGVVSLVYILRIAQLLFPRHPSIALATIALVGTLPAFVSIHAVVCNEALAILFCCGAFHGALRMLVEGPTTWRFVIAGLWMALAPYAKFTAVAVVAPALLMTFIALVWHGRGGWWRRLAVASGLCVLVLACALIVNARFYLNNLRLYGDFSGAKAFLPLFKRKPNGTVFSLITSWAPWASYFKALWIRLAGNITLKGVMPWLPVIVCAWPLAGLVRLVPRLRRTMSRDPRATGMLIALLTYCGVMLAIFMYHAKGGHINARYSFVALFAPALLLSAGMAATRSSWWMTLSAAGFVLLGVATTVVYARELRMERGSAFAFMHKWQRLDLRDALNLGAALLALGIGLLLLLSAIRRAHRAFGFVASETPVVDTETR